MVRHTLHLKNGHEAIKMRFAFDSAAHVEDFCRLYAAAVGAEKRMKELGSTEACDRYGAAIMALYALVLGENNARCAETWFGANVLGMVRQINPVIVTRVLPDVEKCSAVHRERMKRDFLRQQKRAMKHAAQ